MGGLSVAVKVRETFPSADIVYFGDTKNAPYGERPPHELAELTVKGLRFLTTHGATSIVSACNSVSTTLAVSLVDTFDLPPGSVIEMVGPTVAQFRRFEGEILLVATTATVRSGIYQNAFRMIGKEIDALPVPQLAGAIERGASEDELDGIVRGALAGMPEGKYQAVILGCTHYPFALGSFRKVIGDDVLLVDPAEAVADRVLARFWPREVGEGTFRCFISGESAPFRAKVRLLFPEVQDAVTLVE